MKPAVGHVVILLAIALGGIGVWRIVQTGMSDHLASEDPGRSLAWDGNNPAALVRLSRQLMEQGSPGRAGELSSRVLRAEPLNAPAWLIQADLARSGSDLAQSESLNAIAIRRAPYALSPRAWLVNRQLARGQFKEALATLDQILRISPAQHEQIFPILLKLATQAGFAEVLAEALSRQPTWRSGFVDAVMSSADARQRSAIFTAMHGMQDLDLTTSGRWIDRLIKDGSWGEAYARWSSGLSRTGSFRIDYVYNGGFESASSGIGFDWRIGDSAGVLIERLPMPDTGGKFELRLSFLNRRVGDIPVHQWLLLAPGNYNLRFKASAADLRSDRGLQWKIRCAADGKEIAASERLDGNFAWKTLHVEFRVPEQGCVAQDLWLHNAGAAAAGKIVRGEISFSDFRIERTVHDSEIRMAPASSE